MGDTRTYEDFAGMLGRRVARVKEACGGAVGKKQPGGKIVGLPSYSVPLLKFSKRRREAAEAAALEEERRKWSEMLERTLEHRNEVIENLGADNVRYWDASNYDYFGQEYVDALDGNDVPFNPDYDEYYDSLANRLIYGPVDESRGRKALGDIDDELEERKKAYQDEMDRKGRRKTGGGHEYGGIYPPGTLSGGGVSKNGKGGNIMNYTVYFKDGGLLPRSQRRVYQTGGKASAQDMLAMLVQGAQILTSGKGTKKQQQQAQQMYIQMYQEALQGNQQYAQLIQAVFDGVQQGNQELVPVAQIFQEIAKQYQNKVSAAEFGGRLDYITMLRNGGRPRYQSGGAGYGQKIKEYLDSAKSENDSKIVDALNNAKQATREQAQQFRNGFDADKMLSAQLDRILDSGDVDYNNHVPNGYIYDVDKWGNPYYIAPDGHEIYANRRIR